MCATAHIDAIQARQHASKRRLLQAAACRVQAAAGCNRWLQVVE